ncbi:MAG: hypothetical protein ACLP01_18385, partial [Solirubrobacteraceae bacterium]
LRLGRRKRSPNEIHNTISAQRPRTKQIDTAALPTLPTTSISPLAISARRHIERLHTSIGTNHHNQPALKARPASRSHARMKTSHPL